MHKNYSRQRIKGLMDRKYKDKKEGIDNPDKKNSGQFFCSENFLSGQFFSPDNFFCPDNFFVRTKGYLPPSRISPKITCQNYLDGTENLVNVSKETLMPREMFLKKILSIYILWGFCKWADTVI